MKSRYIHTHRQKLPKKRRSMRLYGSFEDANKWYRCWNCGYIFDLTKIGTGDGSGAACEDFALEYIEVGHSSVLGMEPVFDVGVVLENGADGTAVTRYYTPRKATSVSGCPFCGSRNQP